MSGDADLTERQRGVVECDDNCFVRACPGAGKTRTMVSLFMKVVAQLPPRQGAAVISYTNGAANEIRERCARMGRPEFCEYPHFVGTFDAFVARYLVVPFGSRWAPAGTRVRIVESWEGLGLHVQVTTKNRRRVSVPLDAFPLTAVGAIEEIDFSRVPYIARAAIQTQVEQALRAARRIRDQIWKRGYLSCDDARVCALIRLRDTRGARLLAALAARFRTLIIDEAQDCSQIDLEILARLRDAGIRTVGVADPDQAIFAFRGADATALATFAAPMRSVFLEENFRNSQIICQFASSLRQAATVDIAVGRHANEKTPILLMPYEGAGGGELGRTFSTALGRFEVPESESIVIAHQLAAALRATGRPGPPDAGGSAAWRLADAVVRFRTATGEPKALLSAVQVVERLLLLRVGVDSHAMSPEHAAEEQAVDIRWLRAEALQLLGSLARVPLEDSADGKWIATARRLLGERSAPLGRAVERSPKQLLPDRQGFVLPPDSGSAPQTIRAATAHSVKGREYHGVMVVLPNNKRTEEVINVWEARGGDEARSVLYVAATRARRVLAIAVPSPHMECVHRLAARDGAPCEVVPIAPTGL
jgi:DNA helicase II / ATP-dependent DNA helicase PcrA